MNKKVFFVGVGGIGVSALAKYLYKEGCEIFGSDREINGNVIELQKNFELNFVKEHDQENFTDSFDFLIYSPAVPVDNPERLKAKKLMIKEYSYPEYLGKISENKVTFSIAGTNGKTTTTTMIAELLDFFNQDASVVIGGIATKFDSNFISGKSENLVVESCEFKNSFLNISPDVIAITNITPDHLDFFGNIDEYKNSFLCFLDKFKNTEKEKILICNTQESNLKDIIKKAESKNIKIVCYQNYKIDKVSIPGEYNRENARVALAILDIFKVDLNKAKDYLEKEFVGSKRRFSFLGKTKDGAKVYDDYAHNPEGLKVLKEGLDEKFPDKKKVLVFQPHLFSRTQNFFHEFVNEISKYDEIYILPIYKSREDGNDFEVTSESLLKSILEKNKSSFFCEDFERCLISIQERKYNQDFVLITVGAGDIYDVGKKLVV